MIRRLACALACILACALLPAGAARAADAPETVTIDVQKGHLLRLPRPAQAVFVADPEIADVQIKSPSTIFIQARKPGETSLFAVDDKDRSVAELRVVVTQDLARIRAAIARAAPDAAVTVESLEGALTLDGTVDSAVTADDIRRIAARFAPGPDAVLDRLRIAAPNQVNLRVRIAEVSRRVVKQFGFNWEALFSGGGFMLGLATGHSVLTTAGAFVTRTGEANSITGRYRGGSFDLNSVLDALAGEGLVTVLAEPNLTALSGQPASFLAGGEFPIPVPQTVNTITIEFKRFGVSLAFTPTLLGPERMSLKVNPEVSELSENGAIKINNITIPAITTRRAETTVELASGQSFAIAGLLKTDLNHTINGLPLLSELPVVGSLFRSDKFQRGESELIIIVTPYIVRPVQQGPMALPTDGLKPATDIDRLAFGRLTGTSPTAPEPPVRVGFILE